MRTSARAEEVRRVERGPRLLPRKPPQAVSFGDPDGPYARTVPLSDVARIATHARAYDAGEQWRRCSVCGAGRLRSTLRQRESVPRA